MRVSTVAVLWRAVAALRRLAQCTAVMLAVGLAGCQSVDTEGALGIAPEQPPAPALETLGSGTARLLLLLPRSAPGTRGAHAADAAAGARMAMSDLGAGDVSLSIADTGGSPATARKLAEEAIAAGTRLVIGPSDTESAAAVAALPAKNRPPVLLLASEAAVAPGLYGFSGDAIESAAEGVRAAAASGHSRVIVLVPEDYPSSAAERLRQRLSLTGARLVATLRYPPSDGAVGAALRPHAEKFRNATVAVIFGPGRAPATVAATIVSEGLGSTLAALVGNSGWPRQLYAEPVLDGALVALTDQDSLKVIAQRYEAANGRPLSLEAAYAYDAVALAAGLVRSVGAQSLSAATLTAPTGFRGATGMFRFHRDGTVERRHTVYRIERGQLVVVQNPGDGF